jgi:hypothetical protein
MCYQDVGASDDLARKMLELTFKQENIQSDIENLKVYFNLDNDTF